MKIEGIGTEKEVTLLSSDGAHVISVEEILSLPDPTMRERTYGGNLWRDKKGKLHMDYDKYEHVMFNKKSNTIDLKMYGCIYQVDLNRCKTAESCLDWIHQLHEKAWYRGDQAMEFIDLLFRLIPVKLWSMKL